MGYITIAFARSPCPFPSSKDSYLVLRLSTSSNMKSPTPPAQSRAHKARHHRSTLRSAKFQGSWVVTVFTLLIGVCFAVSIFYSYIIYPWVNNATTGLPHGKPLRFFPLLRLTLQIVQSRVLRPTSPSFKLPLPSFRWTSPAITQALAPAPLRPPPFQLGRPTRRLTVALTASLLSSHDPNCPMFSLIHKTRPPRESHFLPRRIGGRTHSDKPNVLVSDKPSKSGSSAYVCLSILDIGSSWA
jgi:hypothetical protein